MILESVKNGSLIWPTIEENRVTMTKKYVELSTTEKIQVDCDMKATNIILQGLPADIYSLERECKLYDAFDKFAHVKGESLHNLPPEWSKFVTDVKLVKHFHTTNYDQLHAYLEQHELHANEVRIMRECNQDPLVLVANHHITPSHFNAYQYPYNNPQFQQQFSPSQSPYYGSIPSTQHYSTTYPSTPLAISYPLTPYVRNFGIDLRECEFEQLSNSAQATSTAASSFHPSLLDKFAAPTKINSLLCPIERRVYWIFLGFGLSGVDLYCLIISERRNRNGDRRYTRHENVVFNESVMYKDTLKDFGASDKFVEELHVEVELQRLNNHTPEEDQTDQEDGDDKDAGDQETDQPPDLIDYQLVRDREPRTPTKPLSFQDESNMAAYAFAAVEEEDTHEPLTYQEAVACDDSSK
ncbi:hypothetical protein Tco_1014994 [Tanacetum coccineum]